MLCFVLKLTAIATVMGVFTFRHLVWGQLILLTLVLNKITDAQQTHESLKNATTAPPLNATGNHTANNASNASSNSVYSNNTTTQSSSTTQMTPTVSTNNTSGTTLSNLTVTASAEHPTTTENDKVTSSTTTTTNLTAVASTNSTEKATLLSTKPVTETTAITYTVPNSTHSVIDSQAGLNRSEQSLTIFFSVLLCLIVLVTLVHFVYKFSRSKERSIQYTHRRLQNDDTGEPFAVADDTMVISGGLYDGPQIYNPTMTVQNEEEFQTDAYGFASRPTQFRLEFLREDQDKALDHETSTFQTFQAQDQEP